MINQRQKWRLDVVAHACHWRLRQDCHEFEFSLGYTVRTCLNQKKLKKIKKLKILLFLHHKYVARVVW